MDYLQASEYEIQKLKDQNTMLQTQNSIQRVFNNYISNYNLLYKNNYGYNQINYGFCNQNYQICNTINSGFINKETTIENKEVEEIQFDYNREFVYQSEWDKYGCDLGEYNFISDDEKRLFKDCSGITQFSEIYYYSVNANLYIKYNNIHYFGDEHDNCIKYSFLKKDFNYDLKQPTTNKKLEQLNKKFKAYKNYKQNKQFIDKYYDKIVPDNIQTNYDYIEELIKESEE